MLSALIILLMVLASVAAWFALQKRLTAKQPNDRLAESPAVDNLGDSDILMNCDQSGGKDCPYSNDDQPVSGKERDGVVALDRSVGETGLIAELLESTDSEEQDLVLSNGSATPEEFDRHDFHILCHRKSLWTFGLTESTSSTFGNLQIVEQNSTPLKKNSAYWEIADLFLPLKATTDTNQTLLINPRLDRTSPIVFKLQSLGSVGKLVRSVNHGDYLVLVPREWTRSVAVSGAPTLEPEETSDPNLLGHQFLLHQGEPPIAFETNNGKVVVVSGKKNYFHLSGHAISDNHDGIKNLFGKAFPRIIFSVVEPLQSNATVSLFNADAGSEVITITLESKAVVDLMKLVAKVRSGNYRIELRDDSGTLLQRTEFRLCLGLEAVTTVNLSPGLVAEEASDTPRIIEISHRDNARLDIDPESQKRFEVLSIP